MDFKKIIEEATAAKSELLKAQEKKKQQVKDTIGQIMEKQRTTFLPAFEHMADTGLIYCLSTQTRQYKYSPDDDFFFFIEGMQFCFRYSRPDGRIRLAEVYLIGDGDGAGELGVIITMPLDAADGSTHIKYCLTDVGFRRFVREELFGLPN